MLQNIVTRNIHELGSKALNTTEIAKQCKHLMVTHNIGQRLFAKYVMNQVVKVFDSLFLTSTSEFCILLANLTALIILMNLYS